MACTSIVRIKLTRRARKGVFRFTAYQHMYGAALLAYWSMKRLRKVRFGTEIQEQQNSLRRDVVQYAQSFLHAERESCDVSAINAGLPVPVPAELDGEIILFSYAFFIAIYLKVRGTVVDGVDIAAIGRTLFHQWMPRISKRYWHGTWLDDERFHRGFVDNFEIHSRP